MNMAILSEREGIEVDEYVGLLEEALPKLGMTPDDAFDYFSDLVYGYEFVGAIDVLRVCAERGVHLSEEALEEIEKDVHETIDSDSPWPEDLHYAKKALEYFEQIRAFPEA